MSTVFTKKINPVTGKLEWEHQDEDYDFHQEIARSAFADMLHDEERNKKYYEGIKHAVEKMHKANKKAHVLDIGTGTGLLSMMAAKCGADTIVACEAFKPMAECALKVIKENGFSKQIHLIPKRSTEITVGEDGDMKHRANILVTEVFDTELIGEGALGTFKHAHEVLLEKDCIVVPSSATIYAQVMHSELAQKWNRLSPLRDNKSTLNLLDIPSSITSCPGAAAVHDIQLSQLPEGQFTPLTPPFEVFRFDWCGGTPLVFRESTTKRVQSTQDGVAQAVFMWWDLVMDMEGQVTLSCAPHWAHPYSPQNLPWRDHWMQAIYYFPQEVSVARGEELTLAAYHDEYSLWFNLHKDISRTRIGSINNSSRNQKYLEALREHMTPDSVCLCLGDGNLLGVAASNMGASKVYCVERNNLTFRIMQEFVECNRLQDKVMVVSSVDHLDNDILNKKVVLHVSHSSLMSSDRMKPRLGDWAVTIDFIKEAANTSLSSGSNVTIVFGEPHFFAALLPWQNIHFWYLKEKLAPMLPNNVVLMPRGATLWAMPVEFEHLWKIRAPLQLVEGFSMTHFDKLIENSCSVSDTLVEPQPLWEYPCKILSKPFKVMELDFTNNLPGSPVENTGNVRFEGSGTCHGVSVWIDWDLDGDPKHIVSTGPVQPPQINQTVTWDMHTRQGVYFFPEHHPIDSTHPLSFLQYSCAFQPEDGEMHFNFQMITFHELYDMVKIV
uniref:Protein arginine N-methyltransferase n=1 Tax=Timema monikensis TaxID=170555 RepID=A0A7R9HS98_9NEOP|nr:unnamed protein product [Timema monikensis]